MYPPVMCLWDHYHSGARPLLHSTGGFSTICHNETQDVTAGLLTEVRHDLTTEPKLQSLTGEALTRATSNTDDAARLNIAVKIFWGGRFERIFDNVRISNPHAPANKNTISNCYQKHEAEKKWAYEQHILSHPVHQRCKLLLQPCLRA